MTRKITPAQLDEFGEVIIPGPVLCGSYCYGGSSTIDGDHLAEDFEHIAMMDPATTLALVAEVRELRAKVERVREVIGGPNYAELQLDLIEEALGEEA